MHEMVLNHTSLLAPRPAYRRGVADGHGGWHVGTRHKNGVVRARLLSMSHPQHETHGMAIVRWDAVQALPQDKCVAFIMELFAQELPLLSGVDEDTRGCEVVGGEAGGADVVPQDSAPLIFCANTNAIAVGFPYGMAGTVIS